MDSKANLEKLAKIVKDIIAQPENEAFTNILKNYFLPAHIEEFQHFYQAIYNKQVEEKPLQQGKDFYKNFKCHTPFLKKKLIEDFVAMMQAYRADNFLNFLQACAAQLDSIINHYFDKETFKAHIKKYRMLEVSFYTKKGMKENLTLQKVLFWKYHENLNDGSTFDHGLKYKMTTFKSDTKWHKFIQIKAVCHYLFYAKNINKEGLYDVYKFNRFFEKVYTIYILKPFFHIKDNNENFIDAPIPRSIYEAYEKDIIYCVSSSAGSYMYILGLFQEIIDELSVYVN